jgi:hypothetical protein
MIAMTNMPAALKLQHDVANGCSEQPKFQQTIQAGQAAWQRLNDCQTWNDWLLVGEALLVGRSEAMTAARTNKPEGRRYNEEMAAWLKATNFTNIDKGTRSRLLDCIEHRAEIEKWRATLTTTERLKINHPTSILRHWQRKTIIPDQTALTKLSPTAKLKASIVGLEEQNFRMKREIERGGGDLWSPVDTAKDIAVVIFSRLGRSKVIEVSRELAKLAQGSGASNKQRIVN